MSTIRKSTWVLITLFILLMAAASAGATYFYISHIESAQASTAKAPIKVPEAPRLVSVPPMTVNLQNARHEQAMLYIGFSIAVGDQATEQFLQPYIPRIRSQLFKLLGEQDSNDLMTSQGKTALAAKVLELVRRPLTDPQPELSILDVLFTDFIVQ
jgi:flagellar protein FliL